MQTSITHRQRIKGTFVAISTAAALFSSSAFAQDLVFGYVPASLEYPYNVNTQIGFEEAAAKAGVKTVVLDPRGQRRGQDPERRRKGGGERQGRPDRAGWPRDGL